MIPDKKTEEFFKVLSCVIYKIIGNFSCIGYLGYEREKLSELRLGSGGSYKHVSKSYENVLGVLIPDMLINLRSCRGFLKNKDYFVIIKFLNRIF